ncbi:MAG TPA: hypothetical protein VIR16_12980 [Candidatus Limnocylindrales bacterium]
MERTRAADGGAGSEATAGWPWPDAAPLFASGTDALAALLRWGAARHGWSRVWLPSYYCPDVPAALRAHVPGIDLHAYADHDLWAPPGPASATLAPGDVVTLANQLGVRRRPGIGGIRGAGAVVVEDHSHDLGSDWAHTSDADYAFASLRKTLPIPDGGVVWSPRGVELPAEPVTATGGAGAEALATAIRARQRLAGSATSGRLPFRALARIAAAGSVGAGPAAATWPPGSPQRHGISPVSRALLPGMPLQAWRARRRANIELLADAIATPSQARLLAAPEGGVAFALTLVFDTSEARAEAQRALAARAVVPTVLWPLHPSRDLGAGQADADLSGRILSVHADQRFGEADMHELAAILRDALREA